MDFNNIQEGIIATIFGGIVLAIIFFLFKASIFNKTKLSGSWKIYTKTLKSSYKPYVNMELQYTAHILQNDLIIFGRAEKTKEKIENSPLKEYTGKKRTDMAINGTIYKNYIFKSKLTINIIEQGLERQSSSTYNLKIVNNKLLKGTFTSTIADSSGKVEWKR